MNAFETLVATLLRREGYWTFPSFKVEITKDEKKKIGLSSAPRWEIDIVAYKGGTGEVLAVECKSFLNSGGVDFRAGEFTPFSTYKMFMQPIIREVVLKRLRVQLIESGLCPEDIHVHLALAAGNIKRTVNREEFKQHFLKMDWVLFDDEWIREALTTLKHTGYEDDIAFYTAKLVLNKK